MLLVNHAMLTRGADLGLARLRMERWEPGARMRPAARTLGTDTRLSREQIDAL